MLELAPRGSPGVNGVPAVSVALTGFADGVAADALVGSAALAAFALGRVVSGGATFNADALGAAALSGGATFDGAVVGGASLSAGAGSSRGARARCS